MFVREVKNIDVLEKRFDYEKYEKYLKGDISYSEFLYINKCTEHIMEMFFKKHSLLTKTEFMYKNTRNDFFNVIDSEIKAYLLGFYMADGSINKNRFCISLSTDDIEIVKMFRDNISPYKKIYLTKKRLNKRTGKTTNQMCKFSVSSQQICADLEKYGIGERKTYTNSTDFSYIPDGLLHHFLRGYFDGDGCVCKTIATKKYLVKSGEVKETKVENFNFNITSYKKEHLEKLISIIKKLYGITPNLIKTKRGEFLLEINKKDDFFKMRGILYNGANFFLKRKKQKYDSITTTYKKPYNFIDKIDNKTGELIKRYKTIKDAAKEEGITREGMGLRIAKRIVINGYFWMKS